MNTMVSQVRSLPGLLRDVFGELVERTYEILKLEKVGNLERVFITGCGDSHHVGITTQLAFHQLAGLPTSVATAMDFSRYQAGFLHSSGQKSNLVIGISVSGSVARTYEALKMANDHGTLTLSLTANPHSRVGKAGQILFNVPNPPFQMKEGEVCPGVRTFFINQAALLLMAIRIGELRDAIGKEEAETFRNKLLGAADTIEDMIQNNEKKIEALVKDWQDAEEFVFVGAGPNYGTALFSAAKMLEASGDSAIGQDTEEWGHLQYFAKNDSTPTFLITAGDRDLSRITEVAAAAQKIGRRVAVVCPQTAENLIGTADSAFTYSPIEEMFSGLVTQIIGELFAAYRAVSMNEPFFRDFCGGRSIQEGGGISRIQSSQVWDTWQK